MKTLSILKIIPKIKTAKSDISWIQSLAIYDIEHTLSLSHDYVTAKKRYAALHNFDSALFWYTLPVS